MKLMEQGLVGRLRSKHCCDNGCHCDEAADRIEDLERQLAAAREIERNVQAVREHEHKRAEAALVDAAKWEAKCYLANIRINDLNAALVGFPAAPAVKGPESEAPAGVKQSLTTDDDLRAALRKCVDMLDALVAESGRGYDYGEEDPFRMGEWFEAEDLAFIEEARTLSAVAARPAVKVKPLVWDAYGDGIWRATLAKLGRARIGWEIIDMEDGRFFLDTFVAGFSSGMRTFSNLEAAKDAAQAQTDHEARILSALEGAQ